MEDLIQATDLVPWSTQQVLPALNLRIPPTGTTCLIGPDSAVTEAFLRTLGGVESPQSGALHLFGNSLGEMDQIQWQQLRPQLGFVTRTAPLLSVLNGLENIILPALYHRSMTRSEATRHAQHLLEELNCGADTSTLPAYLTPLQRSQLAIARAVILSPPVLFIEELFHGFNAAEQSKIEPFLEQWADRNALITSTQNLRLVRALATQIVFATDEKILYFENWASLSSCNDSSVQSYLDNYRNSFHI